MIETNEYLIKLWDAIVKKSSTLDKKYQMDSDYHAGSIFFDNLIEDVLIYATVGWEYLKSHINIGDNITIAVSVIDEEDNFSYVFPFYTTLDVDKDVDKYFEIMLSFIKTQGY